MENLDILGKFKCVDSRSEKSLLKCNKCKKKEEKKGFFFKSQKYYLNILITIIVSDIKIEIPSFLYMF